MTDLFLSYSRKDKEFVRTLHDALEENGRDVWIDWENIPLTADWLEEIKRGIESANSFVYVISPDSVHSDVCAAELGHALSNKKRLVPILHRELVEPHDQAALHPMISSHNWLFFREEDSFDDSFQALVNALDADLDHMRTHTRLLVKAKEWKDRDNDQSLLLRGAELEEAEHWLTAVGGKKPEPTELHTEYIMQSHRAATSRQRIVLGGVTLALVVSLSLAILSFVLWQASNRQALEAQSLAVSTVAQRTDDRILAVALAFAANQIDNPPGQVERALADVVYAPGVRAVLVDDEFPAELNVLAQSPTADIVAVGGTRTVITLWDTQTGEIIGRLGADANSDPDVGHMGQIVSLDFSADGTQLLSAATDGRALLWDVQSRQIIQGFEHDDSGINAAHISADGSLIVTGTQGGQGFLWEVESGDMLATIELEAQLEDVEADPVTAVAFAPPDDTGEAPSILALGYDSGRLRIWDFATEAFSVETQPHNSRINDLIFSPDGHFVYTASNDETARRTMVRTGRPGVTYSRHTNRVVGLALSPDGRQLLTASVDRTVVFWETETGNQITRMWAHDNWVLDVVFSPDGERAISVSRDERVLIWDLLPGNIVREFPGHKDRVRSVEFSPDESRVVSGSEDNLVRIWDVQTGDLLQTMGGHDDDVYTVHWFPDGERVISASLDGTVRVWNAESADLIGDPFTPHEGVAVYGMDISPDGTQVLTGAANGEVRLWDVETGETILLMNEHSDTVLDVKFSPDGRFALSASEDSSMIYWSLDDGSVIHVMSGDNREALSVDFSPDGQTAVSGSRSGAVFHWDLSSGEEMFGIAEHGSSVRGIAYSPNGQWALSASADLTLLLWDLNNHAVVREYIGHQRAVYDVDFMEDGSHAISASRDGTLILWRVDERDELLSWMRQNRYLRALTEDECDVYQVFCDYSVEAD